MKLELVSQLIYLGNNITFTESEVNIRTDKVWIVIDKLTTI